MKRLIQPKSDHSDCPRCRAARKQSRLDGSFGYGQESAQLQSDPAAGALGQLPLPDPIQRRLENLFNEAAPTPAGPAGPVIQKAPKPGNNPGLPEPIRSGIENLSGISMEDVQVHYNSPKPAQLDALAYTQGSQIHVGPGQEKHLAHEAWHVVQQKEGRVRPTMQMAGKPINDSQNLEREADVMAARAVAQFTRNREQDRERQSHQFVGKGILQAMWNPNKDGETFDNNEAVDGLLWSFRPGRPGRDEPDLYQYTDPEGKKGESDWLPAEVHLTDGKSPPMGARFELQRSGDDLIKGDETKFSFKSEKEDEKTPEGVQALQKDLSGSIGEIKATRKGDKNMLDEILKDEFSKIRIKTEKIQSILGQKKPDEEDDKFVNNILSEFFNPNDLDRIRKSGKLEIKQIETIEAGLRYKRVYEHEQNLLTVNRRSITDLARAVASLDYDQEKFSLDILGGDGVAEVVLVGKESKKTEYTLGTFYFGDARYQEVKKPVVKGGSAIFGLVGDLKKGESKQYVQDSSGRFTPRFVDRAIRYEDADAIIKDESMPTKMNYDDPIGGKEASDYNNGLKKDDQISHEQKVIGQIRGYGRFLSATSSKHLATSTSRGTYDSPFGTVKIDLAQLPKDQYTEARSEEAMGDIFDIKNLGLVPYIAKHVKGETANIKAGRDAYRARELVLGSPPPVAVETIPRPEGETGLMIVGIGNKATEDSIKRALGDFAANVNFMEVNTSYKRQIDGHEGRSALIFFTGGVNIFEVIEYLNELGKKDLASAKIDEEFYAKELPSSKDLNKKSGKKEEELF